MSSFASDSTTVIGGLSSGTHREGEDDFTGANSLLFSRDSIDLQPVRSAEIFLDREKKAHVRPMFTRGYEAGFYGSPSRWMMDRTSSILRPTISPVIPYFPYVADARQIPSSPWIMDRAIGSPLPAIPPVYPYFPHTMDVSQRHGHTHTRWTSAGFSGTSPNLFISAHTGMI